jgi:hypothetical protein
VRRRDHAKSGLHTSRKKRIEKKPIGCFVNGLGSFLVSLQGMICESQPRGDEQSVYYMVDIEVTNQIVKVWSGYSLDEINPENTYEHPLIKLTLNKWAREDSFGVMKPFKFVDLARWRNSAGHMFEYIDAGNSSGLTGRPILRYDADLPPNSATQWLIMCQIVENTVK